MCIFVLVGVLVGWSLDWVCFNWFLSGVADLLCFVFMLDLELGTGSSLDGMRCGSRSRRYKIFRM